LSFFVDMNPFSGLRLLHAQPPALEVDVLAPTQRDQLADPTAGCMATTTKGCQNDQQPTQCARAQAPESEQILLRRATGRYYFFPLRTDLRLAFFGRQLETVGDYKSLAATETILKRTAPQANR
jgi:hypothetical protein